MSAPEVSDAVRRPSGSSAVTGLRIAALVGTGAVLVWRFAQLSQIKPRQEWAVLVLVLVGLAVGLTLLILLRSSVRTLFRHYDLFIPLGLYITADAILGFLTTAPGLAGLLAPTWPLKIASITITLSVSFAIQIVLGLVYVGWTTALVLQAVREDRVDPVAGLTGIGRWFLRVFAVEFLSWAVLLVGVAIAIPIGTASIGLALILIAGLSLVWNLFTAAVLPVVVAEHRSFGAALKKGFRVSWTYIGRWWLAVIVQMLILGWVTFIHISYTTYPRPGSVVHQTKTNWRVNGFWTGGYEDTCRWHADAMNTLGVETVPLVTLLLTLMCAVLAIAIKLRIVTAIYGPLLAEPTIRDDLDRRAEG